MTRLSSLLFLLPLLVNPVACEALDSSAETRLAVLQERAKLDLENEELERALSECDEALKLAPDNADILSLKSSVFAQMGKIDAAISSLEKAHAVCPTNCDYLMRLAQLQIKGRRLDRALDSCDSAIVLRPLDPNLRALRSLILSKRLRLPEARAELGRAAYLAANMGCPLKDVVYKENAGVLALSPGMGVPAPRRDKTARIVDAIYAFAEGKPVEGLRGLSIVEGFQLSGEGAGGNDREVARNEKPGDRMCTEVTLQRYRANPTRFVLNLKVDPLYSVVSMDDVIAKFGEPQDPNCGLISTWKSPHVVHPDLVYDDASRTVEFSFGKTGFKSLTRVSIFWPSRCSPQVFQGLPGMRAEDEEARKARMGSRAAETIAWLKAIDGKNGGVTLDFLEKLFKSKPTETETGGTLTYSLPFCSSDPRAGQVLFSPEGTEYDEFQLYLSPGCDAYSLTMSQLIASLGKGVRIDGTDLDPAPGSKRPCISFRRPYGSITARMAQDNTVESIAFWWKGASPCSSYEEYRKKESCQVFLSRADEFIKRRQFDKARLSLWRCRWYLVDRGGIQAVQASGYRMWNDLRNGFVRLYSALGKDEIADYLKTVYLFKFDRDLMMMDGSPQMEFPTLKEYREGGWTVLVRDDYISIQRIGGAMFNPEAPGDIARCKKLFGVSPKERFVRDIPGDLIDSIWFRLAADGTGNFD